MYCLCNVLVFIQTILWFHFGRDVITDEERQIKTKHKPIILIELIHNKSFTKTFKSAVHFFMK